MTRNEVVAKLTELGFYGVGIEQEPKKIEKSESKSNTLEQLESLTKLYEAGNLTKEEFEKAKKKILND